MLDSTEKDFNKKFIMEPGSTLLDATPAGEMMPMDQMTSYSIDMPWWATALGVLFYVMLYLGIPAIAIIASRKNWNGTPDKTKITEFTGFWRRVAIMIVDVVLSFFIVPIFFNLYYYLRDGQTLADKIYGAKLVDKKTHKTAPVGKLIMRPLVKIFSVLALGFGFWVAGWRDEKLAWHDGLADVRYVSYKKVHGAWTVLPIVLGVLPFVIAIILPFIAAN